MELAYLVGATPADVRKGLFTLDDGRSTPYARLIDEVNPSGPRLLTGPPFRPCDRLVHRSDYSRGYRRHPGASTRSRVRSEWLKTGSPMTMSSRTDTAMRKWRQGHVFAEGHTAWVSLRDEPSPARQPKSEERARESRSSAMTTWSWSLRPATLSRLLGTRRRWPSVRSSESCSHSRRSIAGQRFERAHARYAYLPGLGANCFADLSRCTTVEKTVLAKMGTPLDGCSDDETRARFATALAEQRSRFAFPDGTEKATKKLRKRLESKHDGEGDESALIRMVREVRVKP